MSDKSAPVNQPDSSSSQRPTGTRFRVRLPPQTDLPDPSSEADPTGGSKLSSEHLASQDGDGAVDHGKHLNKRKQKATSPSTSYASAESSTTGRAHASRGSDPGLADPFHNRKNKVILDTIDELFRCGISEEIVLPAIVIVGDQSSGKSSLLQSMMDLPFPVGDGLCTRFPTQIISRRTHGGPEKIELDITKAKGSLFDTEPRHEGFPRRLPELTEESFREVIREASIAMGVAPPETTDFTTTAIRNFSGNVLTIEIHGPNRTEFTIVDLPGIFASSTSSQNWADMTHVEFLVKKWMDNPGTIIVSVANGLAPAANQKVFGVAERSDPSRSRTVGVITKCDIVPDVNEVLDLARNKTIILYPHGWFVVRNRSARELEDGMDNNDRHDAEMRLFSAPPWNALPENHRGVHALRDYLSSLVLKESKKQLPHYEKSIRKSIKVIQRELEKLGDSRETPGKQRQYLSEIAQKFLHVAGLSAGGHYAASPLLKDNALKVRKILRDANDEFVETMAVAGHRVPFKEIDKAAVYDGDFVVASSVPFSPTANQAATARSEATTSTTTRPKSAQGAAFGDGPNVSSVGQPTGTVPSTSGFGGASFGAAMNQTKTPFAAAAPNLLHWTPQPAFQATMSGGLLGGSRLPSNFGLRSVTPEPTKSSFSLFAGSSAEPVKLGESAKKSLDDSVSRPAKFAPGTHQQPFTHSVVQESSVAEICHFQSICVMRAYQGWSNEELRIVDYASFPQIRPTGTQKKATLFGSARPSSSRDIDNWIKEEIKNNRGSELPGTPNPEVVPALFRRQASAWGTLAREHFSEIQTLIRDCSKNILAAVCPNETVREKILDALAQREKQAYSESKRELENLIKGEMEKTLQTSNELFVEKLNEARKLRFRNALVRYREKTNQHQDALVIHEDLLFKELHISSAENLADEIHDTLKSYYDLELSLFTESVIKNVVQRYVDHPDGPLKAFSPSWAAGLNDQQSADLAGESDSTVRMRAEKKEKLRSLDRGLEVLARRELVGL